jgi:predicted dehydrogenase
MNVVVIGVGHLGAYHVEQWIQIVGKENVYAYDINSERCNDVCSRLECLKIMEEGQIYQIADIIDIVTPTQFHFDWIKKGIAHQKQIFVEKPICYSLQEADEILELMKNSSSKLQVGHIERFNPAFVSIKENINAPKFFEVHRLAPFNPRGTEVSVIMDLMIHDLDIILSIMKSFPVKIDATGVNIMSATPDIANVRLEFENGCVANLTASRISMKKMRKMRVFSDNGYISIDFLEKDSEKYDIVEDKEQIEGLSFVNFEGKSKKLVYENKVNQNQNALYEELYSFYQSVKFGDSITIDEKQGVAVFKLAHQIQSLI